jgi:hypothetical protein
LRDVVMDQRHEWLYPYVRSIQQKNKRTFSNSEF